jgi:hypothetical protein
MYEETAEQEAGRRRARAVEHLAEAVRRLAEERHLAAMRLGSREHETGFEHCDEALCQAARVAAKDL